MFDSPFEFCPACNAYVVLDQTLRECAREHRCHDVSKCPLQRFFTGIDFAETKSSTSVKRHRPVTRCACGRDVSRRCVETSGDALTARSTLTVFGKTVDVKGTQQKPGVSVSDGLCGIAVG